jgi:ribosomal protein L37AE/L43A
MRRPQECPRCGSTAITDTDEQWWADHDGDAQKSDDAQGAGMPASEEGRPPVPFVMRQGLWTCQACGWKDTGFSADEPLEGQGNGH